MKNIERIVRQINQIYYLIYTGTILSTIIGYYLTMNTENSLDFKSNFSITLSSLIILYIIISIPSALALFHRNLKKWRQIEDQFLKEKKYISGAQFRLLAVGLGLIFSIIGHFILFVHTSNMSMIFCAAIAAIALFFCKPSTSKVINELEIEEEE
jgi:MFS family permease